MALVKTLSMERRPLMLKDYLRDDLSSCSSSGFKSFPRRQCCTTVRFLLEIDLKTKDYPHKYNTKQLLQRSRSKAAASKTISALQRASGALLNAVKLLRFPSVKSPSSSVQNKSKKAPLPRSLSRKLLKRSFWRKAHEKEEQTIKRWKMFGEYLKEQLQPSDQIKSLTPKRASTTTSSKSESNGWAESDSTADVLQSSSGNSESSSENNVVESKIFLPSMDQKPVSNRVGASVGEDSITNSDEIIKDWRSEDEKEQFSPVSVLDYPFEDEKGINSPPFQHRFASIEGTKQKLRRFESLAAKLEPIDLEKRIASFELDNKFLASSAQSFENKDEEEEENETDVKAQELLKLMKSTTLSNVSSFMCKAENLLSDFFREKLAEHKGKTECDLLKEAEDWTNGQPQELFLGWEVEEGRKAYVKDMEKDGNWWSVGEEKEEMCLALELEIFTSLVNELLTN